MAVAGIIAEYNPFHRGHAWQIAAVREQLGEDTGIVIAMSGNFVQRGDTAIVSKHARAEMALLGGADLVLELPTPWASATAERFAQGGVALLAATGVVTHLAFGCESGVLTPLAAVAAGLEDARYPALLRRALLTGQPFARARQAALATLIGSAAETLALPNNALAVEYLRALAGTESGMTPLALPRIGAAHDSTDLGAYPSASAIRAVIGAGGDWTPFVSECTAAVLHREIAAGRAPVTLRNCERAVLARLRTMREEDFMPYDGGGEGLYRRFYHAVRTETSLDAILEAAKTKRYSFARLRRMLLHSYLALPAARQGETPPYLRVLGASERGRMLLRDMKTHSTLPLLTRPADVRKTGAEVQALFEHEAVCTELYTLAMPELKNAVPDIEFKTAAVMISRERRNWNEKMETLSAADVAGSFGGLRGSGCDRTE